MKIDFQVQFYCIQRIVYYKLNELFYLGHDKNAELLIKNGANVNQEWRYIFTLVNPNE